MSAAPPASPSSRRRGRRGRRPGPPGGAAALAELRALQADYQAWLDGLPESLAGSRTAELLEEVCNVDLDALDLELPRGLRPRLTAGFAGGGCENPSPAKGGKRSSMRRIAVLAFVIVVLFQGVPVAQHRTGDGSSTLLGIHRIEGSRC